MLIWLQSLSGTSLGLHLPPVVSVALPKRFNVGGLVFQDIFTLIFTALSVITITQRS